LKHGMEEGVYKGRQRAPTKLNYRTNKKGGRSNRIMQREWGLME